MKSETRRKIADTAAATLVVIMVVIALWLVRCSSQSAPVYYAPDTTAVYTSADTIPDSIRHPHKKKKKEEKLKRRPIERSFLDEHIDSK